MRAGDTVVFRPIDPTGSEKEWFALDKFVEGKTYVVKDNSIGYGLIRIKYSPACLFHDPRHFTLYIQDEDNQI